MARSCGECFKDLGFLMKFIEMILIIVSAIIWFYCFNGYIRVMIFHHLASVMILGAFYFFFPVFCMFVIYIMEGFPDKIYELIICIGGAFTACFAGIFYLVARYGDLTKNDIYYADRYRNRDDTDTRGDTSDAEENYIILAIFLFALTIIYIVDAIMNGAGKK